MILWVHGCSKHKSFLQPLAEGLFDHARVASKLFWISLPEEEIHVINVELFSDSVYLAKFCPCYSSKSYCAYGNVSRLCHCATTQRKFIGSFLLLAVQIEPQTFTHENQTSASLTKMVNYQKFLTFLSEACQFLKLKNRHDGSRDSGKTICHKGNLINESIRRLKPCFLEKGITPKPQ